MLGEEHRVQGDRLEGTCVHRLFEQQVERTPHAEAVLHMSGPSLTYESLNRRANQLARLLVDLGVGAEHPVGLCVDRSDAMLVALLAVLKAGGCYVPLDPANPHRRLAMMVRDTGLRLMLTTQRGAAETEAAAVFEGVRSIPIDSLWPEVAQAPEHNLRAAVRPDHLLYLLHTSGSTGRPKAVAMPHRALGNLLAWQQRHIPVCAGQRTLQLAPLGFRCRDPGSLLHDLSWRNAGAGR